MLKQGKELSALDFADIIGGPLMAVINAQAKAAHTTTNFINTVGFTHTEDNQGNLSTKLTTVEFDYSQILDSGTQANPNNLKDECTIKVPLLSMVPIPFIRVDSLTIDLNVTLHSTSKTEFKNDFTFNETSKGKEGWLFESVSFQTSVTDRNTYQHDQMVDDTYSLHVAVHAVQDQLPGGLGKVLNLFENLVQQQGALIQAIMSEEIKQKTAAIQKKIAPTNGSKPATQPQTQS